MTSRIDSLVKQIGELQDQLETEFTKQREKLSYALEHGRVVFEDKVLREHKALRAGLLRYVFRARPLVVLTAPVIYSVIVPLVLLDIFVTIYHAICFPVYGIVKVKRHDHIAIDRHRLAYLNALQKLNCLYCSYANGVISYTREIAGRTEQYWCPIKHSRRIDGTHGYYVQFVDYGDAEDIDKRLKDLRHRIIEPKSK